MFFFHSHSLPTHKTTLVSSLISSGEVHDFDGVVVDPYGARHRGGSAILARAWLVAALTTAK